MTCKYMTLLEDSSYTRTDFRGLLKHLSHSDVQMDCQLCADVLWWIAPMPEQYRF